MPPKTEAEVQTSAIVQPRSGRASTIGMSRASGGIGKNELSVNDTAPIAHIACGFDASAIVLSYMRRSMRACAGDEPHEAPTLSSRRADAQIPVRALAAGLAGGARCGRDQVRAALASRKRARRSEVIDASWFALRTRLHRRRHGAGRGSATAQSARGRALGQAMVRELPSRGAR